jgi:hypothetical protein
VSWDLGCGWTYDTPTRVISHNGSKRGSLTASEGAIVTVLCAYDGHPITRAHLGLLSGHIRTNYCSHQKLWTHLWRIRAKFKYLGVGVYPGPDLYKRSMIVLHGDSSYREGNYAGRKLSSEAVARAVVSRHRSAKLRGGYRTRQPIEMQDIPGATPIASGSTLPPLPSELNKL